MPFIQRFYAMLVNIISTKLFPQLPQISLDKNITSYSIREGRYDLREAPQRSEGLNTVPLKFEQETISI